MIHNSEYYSPNSIQRMVNIKQRIQWHLTMPRIVISNQVISLNLIRTRQPIAKLPLVARQFALELLR